MATFAVHRDINRYRRSHIGPILLGRFLENGLLRFTLSEHEIEHLQKKLRVTSPPRALIELFVKTASACGLARQCEDWNFESDASSVLIRDPSRAARPLF